MGRVIIRNGHRCITFLGVHLPYWYEEFSRTIQITIRDAKGDIYIRHTFNKNILQSIDWDFLPSVLLMYDRLCYDTLLSLKPANINNLFSQFPNVCTPN